MTVLSAPAPPARPSATRQVTIGYLLQLVSLVGLLAQHIALPMYLGLETYGLLSFTIGSAGLLFVFYDHGYNLLTVRRPSLGRRYLAHKLTILSGASFLFLLYAQVASPLHGQIALPTLLQAYAFVLYTYWVYREVARDRLRRVLYASLVNGVLVLGAPILFDAIGVPLPYAPAAASILTLVVVEAGFRPRVKFGARIRRLAATEVDIRHLRLSFVKQGNISIGTIADGVITGGGVVLVATFNGLEAAAIYRVVLSGVALMVQVIPLPKHVLLRIARTIPSTRWALRYAAALGLVGAIQVMAVYLAGRTVISWFFPGEVGAIYEGLIVVAAVPALKALFELETIAHDIVQELRRLPQNVATAAAVGALGLYQIDIYWAILLFYATLAALSASVLLPSVQSRIRAKRVRSRTVGTPETA